MHPWAIDRHHGVALRAHRHHDPHPPNGVNAGEDETVKE